RRRGRGAGRAALAAAAPPLAHGLPARRPAAAPARRPDAGTARPTVLGARGARAGLAWTLGGPTRRARLAASLPGDDVGRHLVRAAHLAAALRPRCAGRGPRGDRPAGRRLDAGAHPRFVPVRLGGQPVPALGPAAVLSEPGRLAGRGAATAAARRALRLGPDLRPGVRARTAVWCILPVHVAAAGGGSPRAGGDRHRAVQLPDIPAGLRRPLAHGAGAGCRRSSGRARPVL